MVKMYIRVEELRNLKEKGKGIASTVRTHDGEFEINIDINKIDLDTYSNGMYCNQYYITL